MDYTDLVKKLFLASVSILLAACMITLSTTPSLSKNRPSLELWERYNIVQRVYACKNKESMAKFNDYLLQRDYEAARHFIMQRMFANDCGDFLKGEEVIIIERDVWRYLVKIRAIGEPQEYWVLEDAF